MSNNIIQPKGVEENERELLFDSYVQKVSGRLRLLRSPSENNKKRWVWELLQNAKDSIANGTQRHVDIILEVLPDRIIFRHNGNPFSNKALSSLIWQMSGEKRGNAESTGRFGTGFLTTHTLSQIVKLESTLVDDDNLKWGVEVTLNRYGDTDEDLRQGIKETLESKKYTPDPKSDWTSFTYFLKNNTNIESAKAGVASLKQNVFFQFGFHE